MRYRRRLSKQETATDDKFAFVVDPVRELRCPQPRRIPEDFEEA